VISNYRGYQTMDSRDHPDVTRGQKANDLISDIKYRADYEDSKEILCFPYTLTDQYDKIQQMQKLKVIWFYGRLYSMIYWIEFGQYLSKP